MPLRPTVAAGSLYIGTNDGFCMLTLAKMGHCSGAIKRKVYRYLSQ